MKIMKVIFDFDHIPDVATFYIEFIRQFALDDDFGANLDALWDMLTGGGISLPVKIEFIHFNRDRARHFIDLARVFSEAEQELSGRLRFSMTA